MVYPEGGPEGEGALLLPNTLVLMKGGPNADNGRKLIDFLLTEEVEGLLAKARGAQRLVFLHGSGVLCEIVDFCASSRGAQQRVTCLPAAPDAFEHRCR
jgi:spermidine/putrescine-binding protein